MKTNPYRTPSREALLLAISVGLGSLAVTSCESMTDGLTESGIPVEDVGRNWQAPSVEVKTQIVRHDVAFNYASPGLSGEERQSLSGFLMESGVRSGQRVVITTPQDVSVLTTRRTDSLRAYLSMQGFFVDVVPVASEGSSVTDTDAFGVVIERPVVLLPSCPNWTSMPNNNFHNEPAKNFGCATAVNFGMMVASPEDLVRGRNLAPGDGEMAASAVANLRKGRSKDLIRDAASSEVFPAATGGKQ